ncbi:MAG: segregation/condensation protein A [Nanoarchaeota archaeon]|nr:segregation/condensation protein A [Nanoarchaeota archaeon]
MDDLGIYDLILSKDLTWEGLLRDIVKKEDINPWDIDINFLSDKYQEALKTLTNIDFRLSGKFLLAAAILLKMKSDNFQINEFYSMPTDYFEDFFEDLNVDGLTEEFRNQELRSSFNESKVEVDVRLPRQRMKPVSIDDLVDALKEAMEVKERREVRKKSLKEKLNYHADIVKIDITEKIKNLYDNIVGFFEKLRREEILFNELVPSNDRLDLLWTFVPLLHLNNEGKIDVQQKIQFGEIKVKRPKPAI